MSVVKLSVYGGEGRRRVVGEGGGGDAERRRGDRDGAVPLQRLRVK